MSSLCLWSPCVPTHAQHMCADMNKRPLEFIVFIVQEPVLVVCNEMHPEVWSSQW